MMAGAMMAILPLLVLFAIFQKQFIEGIALTGIKG
jgi:multiple sugar transport system permease protein